VAAFDAESGAFHDDDKPIRSMAKSQLSRTCSYWHDRFIINITSIGMTDLYVDH
jgi:hypothetical protein